MTEPTVLVVNADDLGLSTEINRGIVHCFQQGIVRSASLMPNGAAFSDAVVRARDNPGLGVGVHLSLVDEAAVAPRAKLGRLVDSQGRLPASYVQFAQGWISRRFGASEVAEEVQAQVRRVVEAGVRPTHVDSHQHLHVLPGVVEVVIVVAREAGIKTIRVPRERGAGARARGAGRRLQVRMLGEFARRAGVRLRAGGLRHADRFWGLAQSGALDEPGLLALLERLSPGVNELMCHPGFADPATAARYQWGYHWDQEGAALIADRVRQAVEEKGIRLANFAEAWAEQ